MSTSSKQTQPKVYFDKAIEGVIIEPADTSKITASIVGPIHGLGDSCQGWLEPALMIHQMLPHTRLVLPNAPQAPVTLNGGMVMPSWYDITGLTERSNEDCKGLKESKERINKILETEVNRVSAARTVVCGFSQGAAVSLQVGLSYQGLPLAGVLAMSGYLAGVKQFKPAESQKNIPVMLCHGEADPMVPVQSAHKTKKFLVDDFEFTAVELKTYAGLQHGLGQEELQDVLAWFATRLPAETNEEL
eukprot:g279.t1